MSESISARTSAIDHHAIAARALHERMLLIIRRVLNLITQILPETLMQMLMIVVYDVIIVENGRNVGAVARCTHHPGVRVNVIIICV